MKYNSGRAKKFDQTGITSDRYEFLGLEQAEPDLGDPLVGVSSIGVKPVPPGTEYDHYVPIAVGSQTGSRYWIHSQALLTQGIQGLQGSLSNFQGTQGSQGRQGSQGTQGVQGLQGQISNFQGTQGNQGVQGLSNQGVQGVQSTQGTQGTQGVQATQGTQGAQGNQGNQGIQGVQGTISNFQGTQGNQGLSNQGVQGVQATQGTQGTQGNQGNQGIQGNQGSQGTQASQGTQGIGAQGSQGIQGIQGNFGSQGFQGTQGLGSQGNQGLQGYSGFQGSQGIQGRQGIQGVQGIQGRAGTAQGSQGLQGIGAQGSQGTQGYSGIQGAQGTQGVGSQGSQGVQGASFQGTQGLQGRDGTTQGLQGTQGTDGLLGNQGVQGTQGLQGRQGTQGLSNQGVQGNQGLIGSQGFQGLQGSGIQGQQGVQGRQGIQGSDGVGTQGSQGTQGRQGIQGHQGVQGFTGGVGGQGAQGIQGRQGTQGTGFQGAQGSPGLGGSTGFAVIDFNSSSSLIIGSGARVASPTGSLNQNPGSSTQVPSSSFIGCLDGNTNATPPAGSVGGTRTITTRSKVFLSTVSYLYFYVIKDWYEAQSQSLFFEYSYDNVTWTPFANGGTLTSSDQSIASNAWTLREIEITSAEKYYSGVYLRFRQANFFPSAGYDGWAVSSVVASTGSGGATSSTTTADKLNIAVMDFSVASSFTLGDGARISTPGVDGYAPSSSSIVPSWARIGMLDGVRVSNTGARVITTKNRVYLSTVDYLYFYVNYGYYETQSYTLAFQYSLDNVNWTTMLTVDPNNDATLTTATWNLRKVLVPSAAKDYAGVYLRFYQATFFSSLAYDSWAVSSVMAYFSTASSGSSVYDGNIQLSVLNFNNSDILTIGSGARITSPTGTNSNPASSSIVPSYTKIGALDGNIYASPPAVSVNGDRSIANKNRVYLSTVDYLYFYVFYGYFETQSYTLAFQYSLDNVTWTTMLTIDPGNDATLTSGAWNLRKILVPSAAKDYAGVYLRFRQANFFPSAGYDGWAVSPVMVYFSGASTSSTSSFDGNLRDVVMNFDNSDILTIGTGARITSPTGTNSNPGSSSIVPSYTNIGVLDGNIFASPPAVSNTGTRIIANKNRVRLTNIKYLSFYVIKDWYESASYDLFFQYSLDNSSWTNLMIISATGDSTIATNSWSLRKVLVPSGAKDYAGVYLRFSQSTFFSSAGYDGWAVSPVVASEYELGVDSDYIATVLNFDLPNSLTVSDGSRITSPTATSSNPGSSTQVPSYTKIGALDGNVFSSPPAASVNGTRTITTRNRVNLTSCSELKYRVIKDWYDTASYDAYFQYSLDGISWTTLDTLSQSSLASNTWIERTVTVPSGAKDYAGVYLRFYQASFFPSAGYDGWAFTSVVASLGGSSIVDDTTTNATRYPTFSDVTSGSVTSTIVSSTKLTYNPSTGTLTSTIVSDTGGNLRKLINLAKSTSYTLAIGDIGDLVNITTGGVIVPSGVFSAGDAITIYNNSSTAQTITQGASVTMYIAGTTTTGNRTLAGRGLCTVLCVVTPNEFVISGAGIS